MYEVLSVSAFFIFLYNFPGSAHDIPEVIKMASYVAPEIREKFETLSVDLKNNILERNVQLKNLQDLIDVLEIISKGE